MDEVENKGVEPQEIAAPETESGINAEEQATQVQVVDKQERNWRELRRKADELERQNRMKDEILQKLMSQQQVAPQTSQREDVLQQLQGQEYADGSKVAMAIASSKEDMRRELEEFKKSHQQSLLENKIASIKSKYSDFDEVVNSETLALLEEHDPDMAQTIADNSKDPVKFMIQSYKYIKASGLAEKVPGYKRGKEVEKKIEQNKKTVPSPMAFDKRPMAQAFSYENLSDDQKSELQKEMHHYARMAGGF